MLCVLSVRLRAGISHGTFNFLFRDNILAARNAFAATKPAEQRRFYEGTLTGPLKFWPKTFFLLSLDRDEEDLTSIVYAQDLQGPVLLAIGSSIVGT